MLSLVITLYLIIIIFTPDVGDPYTRCTIGSSDFGVFHGGPNDDITHVWGKHYIELSKSCYIKVSKTFL